MNQTSTWLILFFAVIVGLIGLLIVAKGEGTMEYVGWLATLFGLLVGIAVMRRLGNGYEADH